MPRIKKSLKVIHLNYTDILGGAGRAAYRIHCSLLDQKVNSIMWVNRVFSKDKNVKGPENKVEKILAIIKPFLLNLIFKCFKSHKSSLYSLSIFPSKWVKRINNSDADVIHLHWVQGEMISISDVSKISKPIVWTLHDMWAFCGAEHYTNDFRWFNGYKSEAKLFNKNFFDLNRWVWKRKSINWKTPLQIVSPSRWLLDCVKKSKLMSKWPVTKIHNPIDTRKWKPFNKRYSRNKLNLPKKVFLITYGAMGGDEDPRKGFDLLIKTLSFLKKNSKNLNLELVTFGNNKNFKTTENFPTHFMGNINEDYKLRMLYSATDAVIVPSRQDNLPNIVVEAQACAAPVIAFNVGGLSEIVTHKKTGYLAKPFSVKDLANGISWVLKNNHIKKLNNQSKLQVIKNFSNEKISKSYLKVYKKSIINYRLNKNTLVVK